MRPSQPEDAAAEESVGLILRGRVQGVAFRWWVKELAGRLELRGTVRNRPDGSVEVHVAGARDSLAEFLDLVHTGPRHAEVESVEEVRGASPLPSGFHIVL